MAVMRDLDAVVLHAVVRPRQVHYHDDPSPAAGPEHADVNRCEHAEEMVEVDPKLRAFPLAILERPDPPPFLQPGHEPGRIEPGVGGDRAGVDGPVVTIRVLGSRSVVSVG